MRDNRPLTPLKADMKKNSSGTLRLQELKDSSELCRNVE